MNKLINGIPRGLIERAWRQLSNYDTGRLLGAYLDADPCAPECSETCVRSAMCTTCSAMLASAPSAPATVQGDGWIPVSERLPNIVQEVIVNSEFDGITAGFLDSYGEWYSPNSDYKLKRVVAWQPLPAPPAIAAAPKAEQPPVQVTKP